MGLMPKEFVPLLLIYILRTVFYMKSASSNNFKEYLLKQIPSVLAI